MLEPLLLGHPGPPPLVTGRLLFHFDSGITDAKGHTVTLTGSPTVSTARAKFGAASLRMSSQTQLIRVAASDDLILSGDFTVEFFICRSTSGATNIGFFAVDAADGIVLQYSAGTVLLYDAKTTSGASAAVASSTINPTVDVWYHMAIVRSGNNWYIYFNGNRIAAGTSSLGNTVASPIIVNGLRSRGGTPSYAFSNTLFYMDEFALTNGVAKYTGNTYTPPAAPLS